MRKQAASNHWRPNLDGCGMTTRLYMLRYRWRPSRRIRFVLLGWFFLCTFAVTAQSPTRSTTGSPPPQNRSVRKARQAYEDAIRYLRQGRYDQAINGFSQSIERDSNFTEAYQALADVLRRQKDFRSAVNHYQRVLDLDPTLTPSTWFGLGESLLHLGEYEEALEALTRYEAQFPNQPERTKLSRKYLEDCRFSLQYLAAEKENQTGIRPPVPINFGPAINSEHDEYFPKLTADRKTMIFTRKADSQENFFQSTSDPDGNWQTAIFLEGEINSKHFNEGAHCISPDGKTLYFTGCNRPDGLGSCDIYVAHRQGDRWGAPRNLGPPINTSGWEAQPALSADGQTLYFVSNRRGGLGGYDIWKSSRDEQGQWDTPVNLGPEVNTSFDESAPFIHADNQTLYFSSNGWPGFGDHDIFWSQRAPNGEWQRPVNMGYPINDHTEQSAWTVSMNGEQAYFASRREGGRGGLDIYRVDLPPPLRPARVAYVQGLVVDALDQTPIGGAVIQITDLETSLPIDRRRSNEGDGSFLAPMKFGSAYALHVRHPGYLLHSRTFALDDTVMAPQDAYQLTIALHPVRPGHTEVLRNLFFEIAKYALLPESRTELNQLYEWMQSNPSVRIEIGGHTDSTGNEQANQRLSEQRAQAVRTYLIDKGIDPSRIRAVGYGQHKPIADNNSAEGRQQNRRTDFRIIESTD